MVFPNNMYVLEKMTCEDAIIKKCIHTANVWIGNVMYEWFSQMMYVLVKWERQMTCEDTIL